MSHVKALGAILLGLAVAAPAAAQRLPTRGETRAITAVVKADVAKDGIVDPATLKLVHLRVATVRDPRGYGWAAAARVSPSAQTDVVVLRRVGGQWMVRSSGSSNQGCVMPKAIRVDLDIGCP